MEFTQEQKPPEETVKAKLNTDDVELNEDQLEAVAGGADRPWYDIRGHINDAAEVVATAAATAIYNALK